MSAPRKLTPQQEAQLVEWYGRYKQALDELRALGSIRAQAERYGITLRTLYNIVNREDYALRRKAKAAGIDLHGA